MWLMPSIVAALTTLSFSISAAASVTVYSNASEWQAAVDDYSTITFTELPAFTWIDEQYSYLGIHFTDGSDQISVNDSYVDGQGLNGAFDSSTVEFDVPMTTIAMDFPGLARIKLFTKGQLIYTSPLLGGGGYGFFAGLVSTQPFDSAQLYDPLGSGFFADNLYFGPPVPAPAAFALLGVAALFNGYRRRKRSAP